MEFLVDPFYDLMMYQVVSTAICSMIASLKHNFFCMA